MRQAGLAAAEAAVEAVHYFFGHLFIPLLRRPTDSGTEIRGLNMWLEIGDVGGRGRSTQPHPSSFPPGINRA